MALNAIAHKLPTFWSTDPALWFLQVDAHFANHGITQDATKFNYVVAALSPSVASEVRDIIASPPATERYAALKLALTGSTSLSPQQRTQALLAHEELGDRKPSQLYRRFQQLLDCHGEITDGVIIELFLRRLPVRVRIALATSKSLPLSEQARLADAIVDDPVFAEHTPHVAAVAPQASVPRSSASHSPSLAGDVNELRREVRDLAKALRSATVSPTSPPSRPVTTVEAADGPQMHTTLQLVGKCSRQPLMTTSGPGTSSRLLFATDRRSGYRFLIDTGAEVSVFPATDHDRRSRSRGIDLQAANSSPIKTYGTTSLELDLGFTSPITWTLFLADVNQPLLGADFLRHNGILVDLQRNQLVDATQYRTVPAYLSPSSPLSLHVVSSSPPSPYSVLLSEFPMLTRPCYHDGPVTHSVRHHIITTGPPVYAKARRLAPDRLAAARKDFEHMLQLGIVRRSSSNWASPLHLVPKKSGELRPCGDYRALNHSTKPDRYPLPHIQDVAAGLASQIIFSKIDLVRAYHQIPMTEEDIEETTVICPFVPFEYTRMPYGLCNTAKTFQRFKDEVCRGLPFAHVYLDDIVIAIALTLTNTLCTAASSSLAWPNEN